MAVSGGGALPLPHPAALTGPRPFPPARGSPRTSAVTWPERGGGERREAAPDVTPPPPQDRRKNEASPPSPPASRASTLGSYPQRHAAGHRRGGGVRAVPLNERAEEKGGENRSALFLARAASGMAPRSVFPFRHLTSETSGLVEEHPPPTHPRVVGSAPRCGGG